MLREARSACGATQTALADRLGWKQSDISKVERGVRRLDMIELKDWLDGLGLSLEEFAREFDRRVTATQQLTSHWTKKAPSSRSPRKAT